MPGAILIDYGCHSFTYKLANSLRHSGLPFRYIVNGTLESPNLSSVSKWVTDHPSMVRSVTCSHEYGKMNLIKRLRGEQEWAGNCISALEEEKPGAIIGSCIPLSAAIRIQAWARRNHIPYIYWLQDLQGRATRNLLGQKFGLVGRFAGSLAERWEQRVLRRSDMVITIAPGHETALPRQVRETNRFALLENWANIEEIPVLPQRNPWALRHGLHGTRNIVYSGTLGFKHDLGMFCKLAQEFKNESEVRVVVVSSGQAVEQVRKQAEAQNLHNLIVLPFQPYEDVPFVLASASVLIAPLDPSAGGFCVPSKVLSYLCAGRSMVIAIDKNNAAAGMIRDANAGTVVEPGDSHAFLSAVRALLNDPDLCAAQGRSARAYAERTFGLHHVVPRFLDILARTNIRFAQAKQMEPERLLARAAATRD